MTAFSLFGWLAGLSPVALDAATFAAMFLEGVGVPLVPGAVPMLAQAALIDAHRTTFASAVTWAALGDFLGALTAYALARWGARFLPPSFTRALEAPNAPRTIDRWGVAAVFLGRWLVSIRLPVTLGAAAARLPVARYAAASALGAVVHVVVWQALIGRVGPALSRGLEASPRRWVALVAPLVAWGAFEAWRRAAGRRVNARRDPAP